MKLSKVAYKPVGLVLGAVSGALAGGVFKQARSSPTSRPSWTAAAPSPPAA
jgi:hypothetical protein